MKKPTLRKMVKEGIIKARIVPTEKGGVHYYIILEKDNREFFPPKKMTDSQVYPFEKDGKTWHRVEPWYRFVDPFEHLKGYKIMDYLKFVEKESA
jgi:DNA-binding PadR family transcriptional regulator